MSVCAFEASSIAWLQLYEYLRRLEVEATVCAKLESFEREREQLRVEQQRARALEQLRVFLGAETVRADLWACLPYQIVF